MSISKKVTAKILASPEGKVITYSDFVEFNSFGIVAVIFNKLTKQGVLKRLTKGKYYKPIISEFGELPLIEKEVVAALIKGQGYLSGLDIFNKMGLSTQVPNEITIVTNRTPRKFKIGYLNIRFTKLDIAYVAKEVPLLQLLDAVKMIKEIPDSSVKDSFFAIKNRILILKKDEIKTLVNFALKYKPSVRAIIGAIIENIDKKLAIKLKNSLNPLTKYKLNLSNIDENLLSWNII